jgi:hypothetical protein
LAFHFTTRTRSLTGCLPSLIDTRNLGPGYEPLFLKGKHPAPFFIMAALNLNLGRLSPQGRWRRVSLFAMVPMLYAFTYYAYETAFFSNHFAPLQ